MTRLTLKHRKWTMPKAFYIFQGNKEHFNNEYVNINQCNIQLVLRISMCLQTFPCLLCHKVGRLTKYGRQMWVAVRCHFHAGWLSVQYDFSMVFSPIHLLGVKESEISEHIWKEHWSLSHCMEESCPQVLLDPIRLYAWEWDFDHVKPWRALGDLLPKPAFIALPNHDMFCERYLEILPTHSTWLEFCFPKELNPLSLWKTPVVFPNLHYYVYSGKRNHKILWNVENKTWLNILVLPTWCCLWKSKEL